jgi:putative DNA primase/helicase
MTLQMPTLDALNGESAHQLDDLEMSASNIELDALVLANDDRNKIGARIARLGSLNPIERAQQIKAAAKELGVPVAAVKQAVKQAEDATNTKGQGRPLEFRALEPWPDAINGATLLAELCAAIRQYLILPNGSVEVLALWAVHTHAFKCFGHTPRLAITSPEKGCGKTTTLDVLAELVARPLSTSNATVAAVFRVVATAAPTLLIDEADTFLKENDELRGILNSGNKKGGQVVRTVGDDYEPRQFSTWAPAAIAMIGRLPETLEDRSVAVGLRRRKPTERVKQFRSERANELRQLARKTARWVADNQGALAAGDPDTGILSNRAADNWRPFFAIADLAGGDWPLTARKIAEEYEGAKQDQSKRTMLLSDIRGVFAAKPYATRIASIELALELGTIEGRPWAEWRNGKPITAAGLARMLAPFGILSGTRRDGSETFKGYLLADFEEAFASYLGDHTVTPSQLNNHGHCDALQSVTPKSDVTVSKLQKPNGHGHCDGVTLSQGVDPDGWTFNLEDSVS